MRKTSEDFIKEITQKITKTAGGEPGQDQGLFINEDNSFSFIIVERSFAKSCCS